MNSGPVKISDMPVMRGASDGVKAAATPWSRPKEEASPLPPRPPSWLERQFRDLRRAHKILGWIAVAWAVVLLVGKCAPHDFSKQVPLSTVPANTCQWNFSWSYPGYVVKVTETSDAGYAKLYDVVCSDGLTLHVAQ